MHIGRRWLGEFQTSFKFSPPGKDQCLVQLLQSRLRVGASNQKRVLEICLLKNGAADLQETKKMDFLLQHP